ncbi:NEDD8-activating enzyme E1 regulatory subunit-like [Dysidea avara]|uniref:NEDD8-activating enzyme E1 regulatory subunit-like n=1 Tax=Dysidea avara TaxID=196820 RepID=UPI003331D9A7
MSDLPTEKTTRYDRQLRLWGDHGQALLEAAHVCLINASATGTEILKNLVLPGIGGFTIVDSKKVTSADLGNNFFFDKSSVGKSRATSATALLLELNSEVKGCSVEKDVMQLINDDPDFFKSFATVVATEMSESTLLELSKLLWRHSIPLLVARSYGFLGYLRLAVAEHCVVESHPDNAHHDLRIDVPFAGLCQYVDGINLDTLDSTAHSHVPFIVLLMKWAKMWRDTHNGDLPKNYAQKKEFKELLRQGVRMNEKGSPMEEENFDEAIKSVNTALVPTSIPSTVLALFSNVACTNLVPGSRKFWFMVRALKEFVTAEGNGLLPVRGSIPDMTATSKMFIDLQKVYQTQANADTELFKKHLDALPVKSSFPITMSDVKHFCKNAAFLRVIHCKSLEEEYNPETLNIDTISTNLADPTSLIVYYILLRAADRYHTSNGYYPGSQLGPIESDVTQMKDLVSGLIKELQLKGVSVGDEHIIEMCRYGAAEFHSVSAYLGGVAAQEVIKLITCQYVPFCNTHIYNATTSSSMTYEL